jgi:hypothetical protein
MDLNAFYSPDWVVQGYPEVIEALCFPQDMDTLERATMEFSWYLFNGVIDPNLIRGEAPCSRVSLASFLRIRGRGWKCFRAVTRILTLTQIVAWWQMHQPPTKRTMFIAQGLCGMHVSTLQVA